MKTMLLSVQAKWPEKKYIFNRVTTIPQFFFIFFVNQRARIGVSNVCRIPCQTIVLANCVCGERVTK